MNLTLISNTIQNQDCRNVKFQECITVPTRSTNQQSRQEIRILELQNTYLVIQTKLNLVLTSDTISLSLEQRHEIPVVNNSDIEIYNTRARYVHMEPSNRKPQEEILHR